jgi:hypothetical protein
MFKLLPWFSYALRAFPAALHIVRTDDDVLFGEESDDAVIEIS